MVLTFLLWGNFLHLRHFLEGKWVATDEREKRYEEEKSLATACIWTHNRRILKHALFHCASADALHGLFFIKKPRNLEVPNLFSLPRSYLITLELNNCEDLIVVSLHVIPHSKPRAQGRRPIFELRSYDPGYQRDSMQYDLSHYHFPGPDHSLLLQT